MQRSRERIDEDTLWTHHGVEAAGVPPEQVWTELHAIVNKYDQRREQDLEALERELVALKVSLKERQ
jgi:hypothetical protein